MKKYCLFPDQTKVELLDCVEQNDDSYLIKYKDGETFQELFVPKNFVITI